MKLISKIAGFEAKDPRLQLMKDKKAELRKFCGKYEKILKEQLPQYAIDGIFPTVLIIPDKKTLTAMKGFFKSMSLGIFCVQPQFEWAVKKGDFPCKKITYKDCQTLYVCGLPKEFQKNEWSVLSASLVEFYSNWTEGCDVLPGLIYRFSK